MQTKNATKLISIRGTTILSILAILFCFYSSSSAANSVCRDEVECSAAGYCLQNNTCLCNPGVGGTTCNRCLPDHFVYPTCTYCKQEITCNGNGGCLDDGKCFCNSAFNGTSCDRCAEGFYGYPSCTGCSKQLSCNSHGSCSNSGKCDCDYGFTGEKCDRCLPNRSLPYCTCNYPLTGDFCERCLPNHYNYPSCVECIAEYTCSGHGTCANNGTCVCNKNIVGSSCDSCSPGHFNYPSCIECDPINTCNGRGTCNNNTGACECKDYTGNHCEIEPFYYSYFNTANISVILLGDSSYFQASVLAAYDNIIQTLSSSVSRSSVRSSTRATSQFIVDTKIYTQNACTTRPAQYIQKMTNTVNSTQINTLLSNNGYTYYQATGSNLNAVNVIVACTAPPAPTTTTNTPATVPPVVKSNSTTPPLPGDIHPTSAPSNSIDQQQQVDLLQSEKTAQSIKTHRDIRLGVGLGLGIGIPFLIAGAVAVYYFATRKPRESFV